MHNKMAPMFLVRVRMCESMSKKRYALFAFLSVVLMQFVFLSPHHLIANPKEGTQMKLESSSFRHNESIPIQYTGEGQDLSPALTWKNVPSETRSLVLICDDPDAPMGTWDHWILYNIPPTLTHIEEGGKNLPSEIKMGKNSWGRMDYGGPMPPSGTHHYHFTLYALNSSLDLPAGVTKSELKRAMEGKIIAEITLTGLYQRQHAGKS